MAKLTEKQKRFCEEYLIDLNATQAAIRAGYKVKKKQQASEIGAQLLKKTQVAEEIAREMAERSKRTGITQDRVLLELARIAFVNPNNLINVEDGSIRDDASDDDLACIQSVKVKTSEGDKGSSVEREVRLNDKMKALEKLGQHLGMFKNDVNINGEIDTNIHVTFDYGDDEDDEE